MIQISELQQDGIQKLIDGLKELLESQVFSIYGFDPETEIDILRNQVSNLSNDLIEVVKAVNGIQNVVKPDETDVHNINRRIELLAQRIAILESDKKGWFKK